MLFRRIETSYPHNTGFDTDDGKGAHRSTQPGLLHRFNHQRQVLGKGGDFQRQTAVLDGYSTF